MTSRIHPTAILDMQPVRGYTARDPGVWLGCTIGAETVIGAYAVIYAGIVIGAHCLIGDGCKVREGVRIGDRVALHWDVTVNYGAQIGDDTVIGTGSHITGRMQIGQRCFFGAGVMTANDPDPTRGYDSDRLNPPTVGDDVLIGVGAILLPGARIGDGARIGAGAIVDGDVPAGARVAAARGRRVAVSIGHCARCNAPLDNVSPGFAVVAGGVLVCANCLQPGEEIARARSVES